ncbi:MULTISPECIES: YbgC/FadM family acyl-CoA thioesterase [unclassified Nitratiruptor]|uniref:YbgC/FadM family acyl-CoA thioesterase n=1 Tax=unclassified Nitratiruptor TaxID=2624044 RepID=UPI0019153421|nr:MULTISPECIES: YbgC/FadM family acyl-CoA thioesterase [unclassified Nitratiruptor]BCD59986.1 acyl-CoA thioester hydrolase [Nitratiruptor sp. YY08-10]BCD63909.1 acyl-CoA thioester hydrolase [Nitratiruptor sp. YY08-14]
MKIRVYYEDVDIGGIVYHSKYLNFCERARSELFFEKKKSPVYEEYHFVVKELRASYLKPAFFGDLLKVKTKLLQTKGARIKLLQNVYKEEDIVFAMEIELVCMKGLKPSKIPSYFLEAFDR